MFLMSVLNGKGSNILCHVIHHIVATQCETVIFPRVAKNKALFTVEVPERNKKKKKYLKQTKQFFPKSLVRIQPHFSLSVYDTLTSSYSFHLDF